MKKFTERDISNLNSLLTTAADYLNHPEVRENFLATDLIRVKNHLGLQLGRSLSKIDYREIAPFIQRVADTLSSPRIARIPFALPSIVVASRLRDAIAEMKKYTRLN